MTRRSRSSPTSAWSPTTPAPRRSPASWAVLATSVTLDTTDVYLEAAFWWPESIQGRPKRLNFSTEAAHRFERGVDFGNTVAAIERLTHWIVRICGTASTRVGPVDDTIARLPAREPVSLRLAQLQRVLGLPLTVEQAQDCLARLQLPVRRDGDTLHVQPPSFRFDLQREVDLIEEVARIHGYENIPALPPRAPGAHARAPGRAACGARPASRSGARGLSGTGQFQLRRSGLGNGSGYGPGATGARIESHRQQYAVMRTNLVGGLLANLRYNLNRQASRVRTFELGAVFCRDASQGDGPVDVAGIAQAQHLAGLAFGPADEEQWSLASRTVDFFDVKGDLEQVLRPLQARFAAPVPGAAPASGLACLQAALHPGRRAQVLLDGHPIGWIGELHPRLCKSFELPAAPVVFEVCVAPLLRIGLPQIQDVPRFPGLVRDIAVWLDADVPAGDVLDDLRGLAAQHASLASVRSVSLFDVFRPSGASVPVGSTHADPQIASSGLLNKDKSLAFRIVLQDTHRSLAEADADGARTQIVAHLMQRWGARVRQ